MSVKKERERIKKKKSGRQVWYIYIYQIFLITSGWASYLKRSTHAELAQKRFFQETDNRRPNLWLRAPFSTTRGSVGKVRWIIIAKMGWGHLYRFHLHRQCSEECISSEFCSSMGDTNVHGKLYLFIAEWVRNKNTNKSLRIKIHLPRACYWFSQ